MLSPFMTVVVLAVLWLIVVVPMVLRRSDERRRERSVEGFGRAMRALGRRAGTVEDGRCRGVRPAPGSRSARGARPPSRARRPGGADVPARPIRTVRGPRADARAPAPLAGHPDRRLADLRDRRADHGRRDVAARRRRSSSASPATCGSCAARRCATARGASTASSARPPAARPATTPPRTSSRFEQLPDTVVRIDDDDIELHSMDTIDLTGLYTEEVAAGATQRRAS